MCLEGEYMPKKTDFVCREANLVPSKEAMPKEADIYTC